MHESISEIKENISKVIIGQDEVIDLLLTALLAEGHVIIEDVPGTGKTKLANTLACSLNADFTRIQFTPDLQPSDVTGIYYFNQKTNEFNFRPGPILSNIVLADEINRAVPRTQSSLLEAMQERQVSVEGNVFNIEEPFMVVATQNPVELEGTFSLPEAQLDRFLLKIDIGYPTEEEEIQIMKRFMKQDPLTNLEPVLDSETILSLREEVKEILITDDLLGYITDLCNATREEEDIELGLSPRASLALMKASQAYALIKGRDHVLPDDIKYLFPYVAEHRIILSHASELSGPGKEAIIKELLTKVNPPVEGVVNE
jgi:MoxR-like ATPase